MASQPIDDLSVRLQLEGNFVREVIAASQEAIKSGRGIALGMKAATDAIAELDRAGSAHLDSFIQGIREQSAELSAAQKQLQEYARQLQTTQDELTLVQSPEEAIARREVALQEAARLGEYLRLAALDGAEREAAQHEIARAAIEKKIAVLEGEYVQVNELRSAFAELAKVEERRTADARIAAERRANDQRNALADRVEDLGVPLLSRSEAQFRAIEARVRAVTDEIGRFRAARIQAGTATPGELAGLEALTAKANQFGAALKAAEQVKLDASVQGISALDAGATKLVGTLGGLAAAYVSVSKGIELVNRGIAAARAFDDAFRDLPVLLNLSAEAAGSLRNSIDALAEARGLTQLEALGAVEEAVRNGANTSAQAIDIVLSSLDLYSAGLARAGDATKIVTDALSAYGRGAESAAEFTSLLGASLVSTRDNSQQFAAGLDRLLPKAVRLGAGLDGVVNVYGKLRAGGLPLAASFANLERSLDQIAETETQRYFADLGFDISRSAIEAKGLDGVLGELASKFGGSARVTSDLSSRGVGLGVALQTIEKAGEGAASGIDQLVAAQRRFAEAADQGSKSAETQAKRINAAYENILENIGAASKGLFVDFIQGFVELEQFLRKGSAQAPVRLVADDDDVRIAEYKSSADALTKSLGGAREAARKTREEFEAAERALQKPLRAEYGISAAYAQRVREVDRLRQQSAAAAAEAGRLQQEFDQRSQDFAYAASRLAARSSEASERFADFIAKTAIRQGAMLADLIKDAEKAAVQLEADGLNAQLRARALDGRDRQLADFTIAIAAQEKEIDALQAKGAVVDDLRASVLALRQVELQRIEEVGIAQARQTAEQRAALLARVDALQAGTGTGLDAALQGVDERVRSLVSDLEKFRIARKAATGVDAGELADLDALIARSLGLTDVLKEAEREKFSNTFLAAVREIDGAITDFGRGAETGLARAFSDIDAQVQGIVDRIEGARADAAKAGTLDAVGAGVLDEARGRVYLTGDRLKFDAERENARELLSIFADLKREEARVGDLGLSDSARQFADAARELQQAKGSLDAQVVDLSLRGFTPEQVKDFVERGQSALQREFEANGRRLLVDIALRPQFEIEQERVARDLEAKLAPLAKRVQDAIAARDASRGEDGLPDPERIRDVERALEDARVAAQDFRRELVEGNEAFAAGFGAELSDRVRAMADDLRNGAELAGAAFDSLGSNLGDAFFAIVEGSKSASEAFKDFARGFVADIARAISQLLAFKLVAGALGFIGFGPGGPPAAPGGFGPVPFVPQEFGGVMSGEMLKPRAFANGGIMPGSLDHMLPRVNYAHGGVARSPQVAVFAEKPGMAEAFVPLPGPDRGIPVEFKNAPSGARDDEAPSAAPVYHITVAPVFNVSTIDARGMREVLAEQARTIGDLVASEIASGSNRNLAAAVRSGGNPARG